MVRDFTEDSISFGINSHEHAFIMHTLTEMQHLSVYIREQEGSFDKWTIGIENEKEYLVTPDIVKEFSPVTIWSYDNGAAIISGEELLRVYFAKRQQSRRITQKDFFGTEGESLYNLLLTLNPDPTSLCSFIESGVLKDGTDYIVTLVETQVSPLVHYLILADLFWETNVPDYRSKGYQQDTHDLVRRMAVINDFVGNPHKYTPLIMGQLLPVLITIPDK
ncbi:hypothetical protein HZB01_03695 [Candidatus Woesearchaeota archaeon]|nr:hypothetical protein [Candidatus Woesearchaeota archaeon]